MRRAHQVVLAASLALAAAGVFAVVTADRGLITEHAPPLTVVSTGTQTAPKPGVVVAHGFAGSARLMRGFADTLARHGFVVALIDFAGHGGNTAPQSDTVAQVERAVAFLRTRPGVDPARISLVGHSMGAAAVTRYATSDPMVHRTVAISLGSDAHLPERLLVIVGGLEFKGFQEVARSAGPERSLVVAGTEHISVLFAPRTHHAILAHLGAPPGPSPAPWLRLLGGGLLLLAFALGMYPLIRPSGPPLDARADLLLAAPAGCAVAVLIGLFYPPDLLPLAVGGYVAVYAAAAGITMAAWAFLRRARPAMGRLRPVHFLFAGYAAAMTAIPIHFGLTHALPGGARWWLLPVVVAAFAILAYATLAVSGGRFLRIAAVSACVMMVLTAATVAGLAPGFLLLILPLLVLLLAWQAVWMAMLSRTATPVWVIALTGAILPAWPAATAMPLL